MGLTCGRSRASTRFDINGAPPSRRILTDWAEWRQLRAKAQPIICGH